MSAAFFILTIFLHNKLPLFKVIYVENFGKTRKSTTNMVDNYVDVVDRTVNIHQKAKNIYTSFFFALRALLHVKIDAIAKNTIQNALFRAGSRASFRALPGKRTVTNAVAF